MFQKISIIISFFYCIQQALTCPTVNSRIIDPTIGGWNGLPLIDYPGLINSGISPAAPWNVAELPATVPAISTVPAVPATSAVWPSVYNTIPTIPDVPVVPPCACAPPPCPIIPYVINTVKYKVTPPKQFTTYIPPVVTSCNEKNVILKKLRIPCNCV